MGEEWHKFLGAAIAGTAFWAGMFYLCYLLLKAIYVLE